jgi:poly-gamma-glutamate synthesis protein (capsule biosynthesis protein)
MAANRIYAKETKTDGIVKIGFAGDILFDDEYAVMATLLRKGGSLEQGLSETLLEEMRSMDIMMVNNEFPYTNRGTATEGKTYTFRADTDTAAYLTDMGVDIVSLANNHIYDFGEIGLLDTLDTLEEMQMPYAGAGRNLEEASAPVYFIAGDIKIAFVSATQIERLDNPDTKGATESSAGTFRCWNPEKLYEIVAQAKENSDFVIVYIHWGTENVEEPDWAQLQQAPEIAEAGADLIIGAHPHCLQGIQYFGDTPVFYSLGNFWFNSKTVDTGMVEVEISKEGLESVRFVPAVQKNCFTDSASEEDRERILSYMNSISYQVSIDADGLVKPN